MKLWLICNRTSCRPIRFVIILVIKQIGLPLRRRPILLITRMITDRIGLHLSPVTITNNILKWVIYPAPGLSLRGGCHEFRPATMNVTPRLLSSENRRKIKPKETPDCLISHLLVIFTRQHEILVTTLQYPRWEHNSVLCQYQALVLAPHVWTAPLKLEIQGMYRLFFIAA